jgi:hypothetical protein
MKHDSPDFIATIDRREGRYFVLTFPDGQTLNVPIHLFSRQAREGDVIHLKFFTDQQARADKTELARHLLNEILNGK